MTLLDLIIIILFFLILGVANFAKRTFEGLILGFVYFQEGIRYILPFSIEMKNQRRKRSVFYLIFFILLKLAMIAITWYILVVPFIDAHLQGYFSIFFHFILVPISVILGIGLLINLIYHIQRKVSQRKRRVRMIVWSFNYWSKIILKVIFFLFLITNLMMLYTVGKGNIDTEVIDAVAKYKHLTVLNLLIISISYPLINRLATVKIHQYFYYYFNLHVDEKKYEERLQQLSKHYSILHTEFDGHFSRKARRIVLRNKYIPLSFTLHYYSNGNETKYYAIYEKQHTLFPYLKRNITTLSKNVYLRSPIIEGNYEKNVKRELEEGPKKVNFPLSKLLIASRVISVLLMMMLICFTYKIYTWGALLEMKSSVFWLILLLMIIFSFTYLFAWFYMNIFVTIFMIVLMKLVGFTEVPLLFGLLIILTVVANLMVLSFWRQVYIERLLNIRFHSTTINSK